MRAAGHLAWVAAVGLSLAPGEAANSQSPSPVHTIVQVRMGAKIDKPVTGRLIVVAFPVEQRIGPQPGNRPVDESIPGFLTLLNLTGLAPSPAPASGSAAAASAGVSLASGQTVEVDGDGLARPAFSTLKPGRYFVQAILDADENYAYSNRPTPGDIVSDVSVLSLPAEHPVLVLNRVQPVEPSNWDRLEPTARPGRGISPASDAEWLKQAHERFEAARAVKANTERVYFPSKALTAFAGKAEVIRAYVLTPPNYANSKDRYPTVFRTEGFGGTFDSTFSSLQRTSEDMVAGRIPPMIWVFLDHSGPSGTNEFADSVNNGPWGKALTEEFIPWLDAKYRTDGKASGRFATGHSSGGWAALWLQVRYPKLFGGAWPTSPDPSDFRDFTNVDIYAPHANAYRQSDGAATPLVRTAAGESRASLQQYAQFERVMGDRGGQFDSFDWVFSPKGKDGRPRPLFDRASGDIDPTVARYWRDNYDIAWRIRRDWKTLRPDLDGKIHLWVGTMDTYYLNKSALLLKGVLDDLDAKSEFHFVEGADHSSVMFEYPDAYGLEKTIAWAMYATARPGTVRPPNTPQPSRGVILSPPAAKAASAQP